MTRGIYCFLIPFFLVPGGILQAQSLAAPSAAVPPAGIRAELIGQVEDAGKKLVDLAQAEPADKFGWRPSEGVRSISEVYMHVAAANYLIPKSIGVDPPAGASLDMEKKITEKTQVIQNLQQSIEHLRKLISNTSDAYLDKPAEFFGEKTTVRNILLILATHMHEHLGQSIAYARTIGVTPPWSGKGQ
jgi:uncharacterized damage-inducible protein DinB